MDRAPKNKFLTRTWALINDPAMKPIISWVDDGKSFVIHDVRWHFTRFVFLPTPLYHSYWYGVFRSRRKRLWQNLYRGLGFIRPRSRPLPASCNFTNFSAAPPSKWTMLCGFSTRTFYAMTRRLFRFGMLASLFLAAMFTFAAVFCAHWQNIVRADTPVLLKHPSAVPVRSGSTEIKPEVATSGKPKALPRPALLAPDTVEKRLFEVLQQVSELRSENQDLYKRIRLLEERLPAEEKPIVGFNVDAMTCLEAYLFR